MKKRILSIMITICMLCVLMPTTVFAATTIDGQFNYSESDGKITITKYIGTYTTVNIPDTINGNPVTSIGNDAFKGCTGITSVTIPDSVTSIGEQAFMQCTNLISIIIPGSVTSIGNNAFNRCWSLTSIEIPGSVQTIGRNAFIYCKGLTSITIQPGVTKIETGAFQNCESFTSIEIPSSVISIGNDDVNNVFNGCKSLTSIKVDDSNTAYSSVDGVLFNKDKTILTKYPEGKTGNKYSIPDSVKSIRNSAFSGCTRLESITIPSSVTSIGNSAFYFCTGLTSITIPNGVTSIGDSVFQDCRSLTSIMIPNSVTSIGKWAFMDCTDLESVFLPDGLDVSSAKIRDEASQVKYSLDTEDKVTITDITLGKNKTSIDIPAEICGQEVVAVKASEQSNVGSHTCKGGTATCTAKALCSFCGKEYGNKLEHIYDWQSENGKYWKQCKYCGDETSQKDIPIISIDGANTVCMTQDYKFSFSLPENVTNATYGYEFENKGEGVLDLTVENGKMSAIISADIYETTENSFKIIVDATTEDGFEFSTSKTVALNSEHTDSKPKDHICDICGATLSQHSGGIATCISKAICEICGEKYGELDSSNHHLEKVPAKEATVTEVGNQEYWYCKDCGKYFSDKDGKKSIELKNTIIQKLSPQMIEGIGQSITVGEAKDLIFRSNAAFSDFVRVELDGKILDKKYYTVKEGSTIVTLKADYVSTLSFGEHTIGIVSENGTAAITFNVEVKTINNNSPMTGDHNHMLLWIGLLFVSGITVMKTIIMNKKHSEN